MKNYIGWALLGVLIGVGFMYTKSTRCERGRDDLKFMEVCSVTPGCTYSMADFKRVATWLNTCPNGIQGELRDKIPEEKKGAIL